MGLKLYSFQVKVEVEAKLGKEHFNCKMGPHQDGMSIFSDTGSHLSIILPEQ